MRLSAYARVDAPLYYLDKPVNCVICERRLVPGMVVRRLPEARGYAHVACYDREEAYWESQHGPVITTREVKV